MITKETLNFLFENRLRNSGDWFRGHKEAYTRLVLEPLQELVAALTPSMLEMDSRLVTEPRVEKTICRIRRDTRFSRDKSLYRDNMWIIFKRDRMHSTAVPGLYVEISPEGFSYGCGFYDASAGYMETLRSLILMGDPAFQRAQSAFSGQTVFRLEGDCFKRPHYPDHPRELQMWLERRNICFVADSTDFQRLFSADFAESLTRDFRLLAPVYAFLLKAAQVA